MAVQIPRLERLNPVEPSSAGRIQTQMPDFQRTVAQVSQGTQQLASNAIETFEQIKKDQIETTARDAVNEYQKWHNKKMNGDPESGTVGVRHIDGDPTDVYNSFEREAEEKRKSLLQRVKLSEEGKGKVAQFLDNKETTLYNQRLSSFGAQADRYRETVKESSLELQKNNAAELIGLFDGKDQSTLQPFNSSIKDIQNTIVRDALKVGTAQRVESDPDIIFTDEDGVEQGVKLNQSVRLDIAKNVSEATASAANALLSARDVEKAKFVMDNYGGNIDSVTKAKLDEKFEKVDIETKAYEAVGRLQGKSVAEQRDGIRALPSRTAKQSQIKQEALKLIDANERYRTQLQSRASKDTYDQLMNQLRDKTDPNKTAVPINNSVMLEGSTFEVNGQEVKFRDAIEMVTDSKQRKALYQMVEDRPKTGNESQFGILVEMAQSGTMEGMPFTDLQAEMGGLSKTQYSRIFSLWRNANLETERQGWSRTKQLLSQIKFQAENNNLLTSSRTRRSGYTKSSEEVLNKLRQRAIDMSDSGLTQGMSLSEINREARDIVLDHIKREKANETSLWDKLGNFFSPGDDEEAPPEDAPVESPGGFTSLSDQEVLSLMEEYASKHDGQEVESIDALREWYEANR